MYALLAATVDTAQQTSSDDHSGIVLALAAGAVGSLLTLGVAAAARFASARREIDVHDRQVADLDDDLARWIVDDDLRLRRQLRHERDALSATGMFYSGEYGWRLGLAKEQALQAYRDQRLRAERSAALILDREGWAHDFWRKSRKRPRLTLWTPQIVVPVLDAWRLPPSRHAKEGDKLPTVDDPTHRTLDALLAAVAKDTHDYV